MQLYKTYYIADLCTIPVLLACHKLWQASRAVAKITARCALYMDALQKFRESLATPTAFPDC